MENFKLGTVLIMFMTLLFGTVQGKERPNIVWIVIDDMSCHFGYENAT